MGQGLKVLAVGDGFQGLEAGAMVRASRRACSALRVTSWPAWHRAGNDPGVDKW